MSTKSPTPQPSASTTVTRTWIRLKHSLPADTEIHAFMPDNLVELEAAYADGELKKLVGSLDDVAGPL